jgi:hypothetical protein
MNGQKLKRLFEAVRRESAPLPPEDFATRVARAVRREPAWNRDSMWEQLAGLFPKLACAAVLVIGICIASDFLLTAFHLPDLSEGVAQLSDQWLFDGNGI